MNPLMFREYDIRGIAERDLTDDVVHALGQGIGRWGNFINQEAYGYAVSNPALQFFPFAVYIEAEHEVGALGNWRAVRHDKAGEVHFQLMRRETG